MSILGLECVNNEVALVGQLQVGSEEAYEAFNRLYQEPVYGLAYRILVIMPKPPMRPKRPFLKYSKGSESFEENAAQDLGL